MTNKEIQRLDLGIGIWSLVIVPIRHARCAFVVNRIHTVASERRVPQLPP